MAMEIDAGLVAVIITVLLAIIAMAVGWGTLRERLSNTREDVDSNRRQIEKNREANTSEHRLIFTKLDDIKDRIINGNKSHG